MRTPTLVGKAAARRSGEGRDSTITVFGIGTVPALLNRPGLDESRELSRASPATSRERPTAGRIRLPWSRQVGWCRAAAAQVRDHRSDADREALVDDVAARQ